MDMYSRECQRQEKEQTRMIPKLSESYILHESWTKLNVVPAKIMQVGKCTVCYNVYLHYVVQDVLSELHRYVLKIQQHLILTVLN